MRWLVCFLLKRRGLRTKNSVIWKSHIVFAFCTLLISIVFPPSWLFQFDDIHVLHSFVNKNKKKKGVAMFSAKVRRDGKTAVYAAYKALCEVSILVYSNFRPTKAPMLWSHDTFYINEHPLCKTGFPTKRGEMQMCTRRHKSRQIQEYFRKGWIRSLN